MANFISEDDLQIFEKWLKYHGADPSARTITPEELSWLWNRFEEETRLRETTPKVGLMKLKPPKPGEQMYAVAIRDGSKLWLTLWVRCYAKGDVIIMYRRADSAWDAHTSYHHDGTFHQKSYGTKFITLRKQPLTGAFKGSEHVGTYGGHAPKSTGARCDPTAFDGVVEVEADVLPVLGLVGVDLVEAGYEQTWNADETDQRFYIDGVHQREAFPRDGRPSVVITICRSPSPAHQ